MKNKTSNLKLIEDKLLLQNPYAHLGDIDYSSISANDLYALKEKTQAKIDTVYSSNVELNSTTEYRAQYNRPILRNDSSGNPYASIGENKSSTKQRATEIEYDGEFSDIECASRELQSKIWKSRNSIWPTNLPLDPVEMLDPAIAFEILGYDFDVYESLDDYANGSDFKIAGLIDQSTKKAYISNYYSQTQQRFTSAHELGHAILHPNSNGMHRDRALDGGPLNSKRNKTEKEADDFAKFYTMPRILIIRRFETIFNTQRFKLDEETAFALDPRNREDLLSKNISIRDVSRILAKAEYYNGRYITSLSEQFKVSVEAMAIRLEELELVS